MEAARPKVVLLSDFKCCQKYKHTLPDHVELIGGDNLDDAVEHLSSFVSLISSSDSRPVSSVGLNGGKSISVAGSVEDTPEVLDETLEDEMAEVEMEVEGEESEDDVTVCSDWVVLKPRRKKKGKLFEDEEQPGDLTRPESHSESVRESITPRKLIPSGFFKYTDLCTNLPKTPPLEDEALRKRAPSPNISMPKVDVGTTETAGEDWIWFEGRYLEEGTWEVAAGEDGEYYRLHKQWKEGHWEPAPWLVEKWEKEELELEKERLKELEAKRKYDEILKREDSPGMDIMNWGFGPVKLERWKEAFSGFSIEDLSNFLSKSLSRKFLEETSEMSMEAIEEMSSMISEAMMENSTELVRDVLNKYFSEDLATAISEKLAQNAENNAEMFEKSAEDTRSRILMEEADSRQVSLEQKRRSVDVELPCDVIPEDFRNVLLNFARNFVTDLPENPLNYAIKYFEDRTPRVIADENVHETDTDSLLRFDKRRKSLVEPSVYSIDISDTEKSAAQLETIIKALHDCWLLKDLGIAGFISIMREMYRMPVQANTSIRTVEDEADHMYIIESGTFQLTNKHGSTVLVDQGYFGEVSLVGLHDIQFPYDVVALTNGTLWCLHKHSFINSVRKVNVHRERIMTDIMISLELFDNLNEDEFYNLIYCSEILYYKKGDVIFCENTKPAGIYFLLFGDLKLIQIEETTSKTKRGKTKTTKKLKAIAKISSPNVLGHDNMLYDDNWEFSCVAHSHIVEIALLPTDVFERVIGDVEDLINRPVKEVLSVPEVSKTGVIEEEDIDEVEIVEVEEEEEQENMIHEPEPLPTLKKKRNIDDFLY